MRQPSRDRRRPSRRRDSAEDMLRYKMERFSIDDRDSNSSNFDEGRSIWSRPSDPRYDRSPATSLYSDEVPPRGSLERGKKYLRDSEFRRRYREQRYRDMNVDIEPGYTYRDRDRERRYERQLDRPRLQRAITYDDYPSGKTEPRYLPAPLTRRLTDYVEIPERLEREPVSRRRPTIDVLEQDAYEAGRRDEYHSGKRRNPAYHY